MDIDNVLLGIRLILAATFAAAGSAKLADRPGSREALVTFGVPVRLANPLGMLLPLLELAIALALVSSAWSRWGAAGAFSLLFGFVVVLAVSLAKGETPNCHCFGQLSSGPAGLLTLTRNVVLAAAAAFVLWAGPGISPVTWLSNLKLIGLLLFVAGSLILVVALLEAFLLFHLLRQQGRFLLRIEALEKCQAIPLQASGNRVTGLPIGVSAPTFKLPTLGGHLQTLDELLGSGIPTMLLFVDPDCVSCTAMVREIANWQDAHVASLSVIVISVGTPESNWAKFGDQTVCNVLLQQHREIAESYQVSGTPTAVIIGPDGMIRSQLAEGTEAIRALVVRSVGMEANRSSNPTHRRVGGDLHDGRLAQASVAADVDEARPQANLSSTAPSAR